MWSRGGLGEADAKWFIFAEYSPVNRPLGLDVDLSSVVGQAQYRTVETSRVISTIRKQAAAVAALPFLRAASAFVCLLCLYLCAGWHAGPA